MKDLLVNAIFAKPVLDLFYVLFFLLISIWGFIRDPIWRGRGKTLNESVCELIPDGKEVENKVFKTAGYYGLLPAISMVLNYLFIGLVDTLAELNKYVAC